jgi:hypothetical protein
MNLTPQITIKGPNWDAIAQAAVLTKQDYVKLAGIIVGGIIDRIRNSQTTANGRPLSKNSKWWTAQKLREGKYTNTLMYTGQISQAQTYNLRFEEQKCYIELLPSKLELHLKLIEISDKTGKNYRDWFGASQQDLTEIMETVSEILETKFEALK